MEENNLYDLIDAYLDKTLSAEHLVEVEQQLLTDDSFQEEVALQQKLREAYSDSKQFHLYQTITKVLEEGRLTQTEAAAKGNNSPSKNNWKWLGLFLFVVFAGIGFWFIHSPPPPELSSAASIEEDDRDRITLDTLSPIDSSAHEQRKDTFKTIPPSSNPNVSPPPKKKKNTPIASNSADYKTNNTLESLTDQVRSPGTKQKITLTSPKIDADFNLNVRNKVNIAFEGKVEREENGKLSLLVFNNKNPNRPIDTKIINIDKNETGLDTFYLNYEFTRPPGLYYFTIESENKILAAGRFEVYD